MIRKPLRDAEVFVLNSARQIQLIDKFEKVCYDYEN